APSRSVTSTSSSVFSGARPPRSSRASADRAPSPWTPTARSSRSTAISRKERATATGGARLRAGQRTSSDGAVPFLQQVLKAAPAERRVRLRMDAGFYARQVEQLCVTRGLGFSISAKLTERLRPAIDALPESVWSAYPWED